MGYAHYQSGNYEAAEGVYRVMVSKPKPDPRDQYSLGRALESQGKIEEAKLWIAAAAAADPSFAQAIADRDRLARLNLAQPPPGGLPPLSELSIPRTDEELEIFTGRLRARAVQDWWIQNWYSIPWPLRVLQIALLICVVAFIAWVGVNVASSG